MLEYHKTVLGKSLGEYLRYDVPQSVEKLIALGILPPIYAHGTYQNREVSKYDEMMLVCYAFTEGQDLATFLNNQKPLMLGDAVRVKDALMVLYLKIFQAGFSPEFAFYNIIVPDDVSRPFNMIYTDTNNLSREPIRNLDGRLFSAHTGFDDWYSKRGSRQSSSLSNQFSSYSAEKVAALLAELVTTIEDAAQQHRAGLDIDFSNLTVEWTPNDRPVIRVLDTKMINLLPARDSATCPAIEDLIAQGVQSLMKEVAKYSGCEALLPEAYLQSIMLQNKVR